MYIDQILFITEFYNLNVQNVTKLTVLTQILPLAIQNSWNT